MQPDWRLRQLAEASTNFGYLLDEAPLSAFRGELTHQDRADEPAAVLLERIRAARAAGSSAKPSRRRGARGSTP